MTKLEAWINKFLFSEDNSEKGLRNPQKVYDLLNIQPKGKIILISGTNGKGTAGEILTQLGLQKGLKVGTFSSPHLIRINERIKINGEPISDNLFLKSLESVKAAKGDIPLNFFQYLALAMMKIFNDENIDLWIVEIGIGGRLDPTNILNADLSFLKKDFEVKINKESILYLDKKNQFKFKDKQNIDSSSIAIAIRSFLSLGFKISENQIQKALDSFSIKGRCEVISEDPYILLDVCHNLSALEKLKKELLKKIEGKKTAAIFASSKNSYDLISPLKEMIDCWHFPRCKERRLMNPEQFLTSVNNESIGSHGESLEVTYKKIKNKNEFDAIIIYGSFYLVGEFLESNLV